MNEALIGQVVTMFEYIALIKGDGQFDDMEKERERQGIENDDGSVLKARGEILGDSSPRIHAASTTRL